MPFKARKAVFEKLEQIVDIAALSKEDREKYDASIKVYRDTMATMAYALEEGLGKGMEKGLEKGLFQVAHTMKSRGMDIAAICQATGLKPEEVEEL